MTLLSIDPGRSYKGEKTIGVCLFEDDGREIERFSTTFEGLVNMLGFDHVGLFGWGRAIHKVLIEDFVNNAQSKGGQRNGTSECIGAVEALCIKAKTTFIRRPPAKLGPAKLHAPRGSWNSSVQHLRHEDSAFLHGHEFLIETGRLTVPGLSATL